MKSLGLLYDRDLNRLWNAFETFPETRTQAFLPRVDIEDLEGHFLIHAELPGVAKEDIDLSVEDNILKITGEKKLERNQETENSTYFERSFGRFERSFQLPKSINSEKIEAHYENGVLKIAIPKAAEAVKKTIEISDKKSGGFFDKILNTKKEDKNIKIAG